MNEENKFQKRIRFINFALVILLFIIVLNFVIHVVRTNNFNNQIHTLSFDEEATEVNVFGSMTGEWEKADALVPGVTNGGTYEFTITDLVDYDVATWLLRLDITQE